MEGEGIEILEPVSTFFEYPAAFVLKIAGLHGLVADEQNARFMIQLGAQIDVPLFPKRNAAIGQLSVRFVRAVSRTDSLADIGRSGERMGQGARIDQHDPVPAPFQFYRGSNSVNPCADNNYSHD